MKSRRRNTDDERREAARLVRDYHKTIPRGSDRRAWNVALQRLADNYLANAIRNRQLRKAQS